jgi:hypothetical protein
MAMRKAQRQKAKLRLGMSGPAGSGKTFGSLLIAFGITGTWEDICLIDTENHSGDLYADYHQNGTDIGEYNIIDLSAPYSPDKYVAAIKECEREGIKVIIIDSLTHAWAGEGGLLDKKGQMEKKPGANSWTAWRDITPMHNQLVETILQSSCHIIATLRAKMEHVQEKDSNGKTIIRKVGMNPIQRDGMEYEFTSFIDIDQDHQATCSKDRTSMFDGKVWTPGIETGRVLLEWLETGIDVAQTISQVLKDTIIDMAKSAGLTGAELTTMIKTDYHKQFSQLTEIEGGEIVAHLQSKIDQLPTDIFPSEPLPVLKKEESLFNDTIDEKTMKAIHARASELGMDHDDLRKYAQCTYPIKSLKDLIQKQAKELLADLRALPSREQAVGA